MCRYFLNGNCRYGDFCRNSHTVQNPTATPDGGDTNQGENNNNTNDDNRCSETNEVARNWIDAPEFIPRYNRETTDQPTEEDQGASRWANQ